MCSFLVAFLATFVNALAWALSVGILIRVILSWVQVPLPLDLNRWIFEVTEPILGPLRRAFGGAMGGLDFSPVIAIIGIQLVQQLLIGVVLRIYC